MKTQKTIEAYDEFGGNSELVRRLKLIDLNMSPDARSILNEGRENLITGEMIAYDLLTQAGVEDITAAKVAVAIPDPLIFHPYKVFGERGTEQYSKYMASGQKPLEALLNTVKSIELYSISRAEYLMRMEKFELLVGNIV